MGVVPYVFAGQSGSIPLTELDINFANVKAYAVTAGTVTAHAQPNITSVGNLSSLTVTGAITASTLTTSGNLSGLLTLPTQANITQVGTLSTLVVSGNVTTGNVSGQRGNFVVVNGALTQAYQPTITQVGNLVSLTVSGNILSGNIVASSLITSGDITGDDVTANGNLTVASLAAVGTLNVSNDATIVGNFYVNSDALIQGNLTVQGTTTTVNANSISITDKVVVVANNVSTSSLINGAGIDAGNPVVSYLRYSDLIKGWNTANNFSVGGNLTVSGTGAFTGVLTAPTPSTSTNNTQVATTAFVASAVANGIGGLGSIAYQNANNVTITGGTFSGTASIAGGFVNGLPVTSLGTNSYGNRTVSASAPTGGNDGDIWFQI